MSFDKLEIIAKPVEGKENRWTVAWKAKVDGKWYGQWIEIPDDEAMITEAFNWICSNALWETYEIETKQTQAILEGRDNDEL